MSDMSEQKKDRLFVGNLSWGTTDQSLSDAFASAADDDHAVVEAKVITDRYTGRSRGFGFVTLKSEEVAAFLKDKMNGVEIDGRPVRVDIASSTRN